MDNGIAMPVCDRTLREVSAIRHNVLFVIHNAWLWPLDLFRHYAGWSILAECVHPGLERRVSFEMDGGGAHFGGYLFAQAVKLFEGFQSVLHKLIEIDRTATPTALAQTNNLSCE